MGNSREFVGAARGQPLARREARCAAQGRCEPGDGPKKSLANRASEEKEEEERLFIANARSRFTRASEERAPTISSAVHQCVTARTRQIVTNRRQPVSNSSPSCRKAAAFAPSGTEGHSKVVGR